MIFHKRVHFCGRPYKFVVCRDRLNCTLSLKTHYKMHTQQNLSSYDSDDFADSFSLSQVHFEKKEHPCYKGNWFIQFYTGKCSCFSFWKLIIFFENKLNVETKDQFKFYNIFYPWITTKTILSWFY